MLKVNERLDKIAAARANFTVRGMLADLCLVQVIKEALASLIRDDGDPMDEDTSYSDETDSDDSDDEFQIPPSHHFPSSHQFYDAHTHSPSNVNTSEDTNEHATNSDNELRQRTRHKLGQRSLPTLTNASE